MEEEGDLGFVCDNSFITSRDCNLVSKKGIATYAQLESFLGEGEGRGNRGWWRGRVKKKKISSVSSIHPGGGGGGGGCRQCTQVICVFFAFSYKFMDFLSSKSNYITLQLHYITITLVEKILFGQAAPQFFKSEAIFVKDLPLHSYGFAWVYCNCTTFA